MLRVTMLAVSMAAAASGFGTARAQDIKLPGTLTHHRVRHRHVRIQHRRRRRQGVQGEVQQRHAHPAGRQRHRPPGAPEERPRPGVGDGHRQLLRFRGRVRVRGQGMGPAAAAAADVGVVVQRHHAQCRQGHRRQGGQGPQGQAHRHGRRLARAQPERLRHPGLRRPDGEGRQAGRVLELRRDVEGHDQQRGRRRDRIDHHRPGAGARDLAARRGDAADARIGHGGLGAPAEDRPLLSTRTRRPAAPAASARPIRSSCRPIPTRSSSPTPRRQAIWSTR